MSELHILEVLDSHNNNGVVILQLIEVRSNGLCTTTQRPTRMSTGTPTFHQEDHTTELPDLFKPKEKTSHHTPSEERSNGNNNLTEVNSYKPMPMINQHGK
jgi:hypothetical protein